MAQNAPRKSEAAASGVSDADIAATAQLLGLTLPGVSREIPTGAALISAPAPNVPGDVNDADVAEMARSLGLKLDNPQRAVSPDIVPSTTPGVPTRITVRPEPPAPVVAQHGFQQQMVEGMPIIGPLFNKAVAAAGAGIEPAINPVRRWLGKEPRPMSAPTFGERYRHNLAEIQRENQQYAEENPVKSVAANLMGGGLVLGPIGATRAGGALLGMRGPTLGMRILGGATGGSAIGTTDAALRGENPLSGLMIGAGGGAAGPVIGAGAQQGGRLFFENVMPRAGPLRDLASGTVKRLTGALEGETPASLREAKARVGPAGFVGDINTPLTDITGAIADVPGPGKAIVREAYRLRQRAQRGRIDEALTEAMGPSSDVEAFKKFMMETRAAAADPLYTQWRSMKVQPTDEIKGLIPRLEASGAFDMAEELSRVSGKPINRTFFTGGAQKEFPTTESWDYVKRGLDRQIDKAYRAGDKTLGRELVKLKNELIDEVGKTDAGKVWNQARKEFAERSSIIDQVEAGRDTFLGGRSGIGVDELREELKSLNGPELAARIMGMRSAVDETMGATLRGDTTLRNKLLALNNVKKMELLIGKKRADDLVKTMEQEKVLAEQYQNVVGGSQTTPKKERIQALLPPQIQPWDLDVTRPGTWLPPGAREQFMPHGLVNAALSQRGQKIANQLAPIMATPVNAPEFPALMRALRRETIRRGAAAQILERGGRGLTGLITGPGTTTARRRYLPAQ